MPVHWCLDEAGSYLVFYDNSHDGIVRLGDEAEASSEGGASCCYLVTGTPAENLDRFTELTGRTPLLPR